MSTLGFLVKSRLLRHFHHRRVEEASVGWLGAHYRLGFRFKDVTNHESIGFGKPFVLFV